MRSHMASGALQMPLSLGMADFARRLAPMECEYFLELADLSLEMAGRGLSLQEIMAMNANAGEPTFIEEFILRQEDFRENGPTARIKARIVLEVDGSCQNAVESLLREAQQ